MRGFAWGVVLGGVGEGVGCVWDCEGIGRDYEGVTPKQKVNRKLNLKKHKPNHNHIPRIQSQPLRDMQYSRRMRLRRPELARHDGREEFVGQEGGQEVGDGEGEVARADCFW